MFHKKTQAMPDMQQAAKMASELADRFADVVSRKYGIPRSSMEKVDLTDYEAFPSYGIVIPYKNSEEEILRVVSSPLHGNAAYTAALYAYEIPSKDLGVDGIYEAIRIGKESVKEFRREMKREDIRIRVFGVYEVDSDEVMLRALDGYMRMRRQ